MAFEVEKAKHYFVGIDGIWKCAGLGLDNGDWIPESAFPGTLVSRDEKLKHDFVEESAWVHSGGLEVLGGHIARYYTGQYHDYSCDEHRDGWTFDAWGDSLAAKASATLNDGRLWLKYGDASFKLVFQRPGLWYPVTRNSELRSCTGDCDENGAISTAPPTQFISRPSPTPEPTMDWSGYRRRDYYQDY